MGMHLIIVATFSFIISLCQVLSIGKLIRLKELKKLYPKATLKEVENFEKNTKSQNNFLGQIKKDSKISSE